MPRLPSGLWPIPRYPASACLSCVARARQGKELRHETVAGLPTQTFKYVAAGARRVAPIGGLVNEVSAKQAAAGEAVHGLLSGQNVSLHQTMIAMEEASISFQLMVEVRNRMLESYQELMRMQI